MPEAPPNAMLPSPGRVVLLNDTASIYHFGCTATSTAIESAVRALGHTLATAPHHLLDPRSAPSKFSDLDSPAFFRSFREANGELVARINAADVVLINGEGTLHGLRPTPVVLLYLAYGAKVHLNKRVQIINHSCYPQSTREFTDAGAYALYLRVYRAMDFVAVREWISHDLLTTLGLAARRSFDCLPLYVEANLGSILEKSPGDEPRTALLGSSSLPDPRGVHAMGALAVRLRSQGFEVRVLSGAVSRASRHEQGLFESIQRCSPGACSILEVSSAVEWLRAIRSASVLVSGRFHHSIAAASLGTPFILLPSNTPKIDSLTELGAEPPLDPGAPGFIGHLIQRAEQAIDNGATSRVGASKVRARLCRLAGRNFEGLGGPVDRETDPPAPVQAERAVSAAAFLRVVAEYESEAGEQDAPIAGAEPGAGAVPAGLSPRDRARQLSAHIVRAAGVCRALLVGPGIEPLRAALLRNGAEVRAVSTASGALAEPEQFGVVVLDHALEEVEEDDIPSTVSRLRRPASGALFAVLTTTPGRGRDWWEAKFFEAGFRKHPLTQALFPFESLEHDEEEITLVFERVQDGPLGVYPLDSLRAERTLHMDMLRESGRRSDAHIARYTLACQYLRPGDTVLDCACGLGYGSAIMCAGSSCARIIGIDNSAFAAAYAGANFGGPPAEFRVGDAGDLSFLADASIDAVVSMETLEHLADPERFLRECRRVLTPAGRVILSVPNDWTDESGKDPNPHHLHVYTWDRVREQVERYFHIEGAYAQVAGGGMKLTDRPRRLTRLDLQERAHGEAEWFLLVGMKSPFPAGAPGSGTPTPNPPYRETTFPSAEQAAGCNLVAYARDYDNPWLVRAMVSIGLRATEPALLRLFAQQTLGHARAGSADQGAAICVHAYYLLGQTVLDAEAAGTLLGRIDRFDLEADDSAHAHRWRISNRYAAGLLLLTLGRHPEARGAFLACAEIDPARFSPLLATKTVDALFQAGRIAAASGNGAGASTAWSQAVQEARRALSGDWTNIVGDPESPVSFGLPEASQVLDLAARSAAGLAQLPQIQTRPGQAWSVIHAASATEHARWLAGLEQANTWLESQRRSWMNRASALEKAGDANLREAQDLRGWNADLEEAKAWLAAQCDAYQRLAEERAGAIEELKEEISNGQRSREWLRQHAANWQAQAQNQEAVILQLKKGIEEDGVAKEWLKQHAANWEAQARNLEAMVLQLKKVIEDDGVAKEWLEQSRVAWERIAGEREKTIDELKEWLVQLEDSKRWHAEWHEHWKAIAQSGAGESSGR